MILIENANVVLEHGILWDGAILVDGERLAAVGRREELAVPEGAQVIDAGGAYVGPGFVDLHAHGGGGHQFWREPAEAARFHLSHGTTSVLPTFYRSLNLRQTVESADRVREAMAAGGAGGAIRGVYMEGPYLNPDFGASRKDDQWPDPIDPAQYREMADRLGTLVRVWAVAPEREGIEGFVRYAHSVNPDAVFSAAHSRATPAQVRALKRYGLTLQTHCMDATGRTSLWVGTRGAGPDEACFLDPDMYAEMICDSGAAHVNAELQQLILRVKGLERVILISDNSGHAQDTPPRPGLEKLTDLSFDAEGNLGGSRLSLDLACRNLMTHTSCGIAQAFLLASRNPARAIGLGDEIGTVEAGKRADLVFVDDRFHVRGVMLAGQMQDN